MLDRHDSSLLLVLALVTRPLAQGRSNVAGNRLRRELVGG
jgi:hypothetical protein